MGVLNNLAAEPCHSVTTPQLKSCLLYFLFTAFNSYEQPLCGTCLETCGQLGEGHSYQFQACGEESITGPTSCLPRNAGNRGHYCTSN